MIYGERGYQCLMPRDKDMLPFGLPLMRMEDVVPLILGIIMSFVLETKTL